MSKTAMIVGLGSGTTAAYAIIALGERIKHENLHIWGIPSSYQAFQLAVQNRNSNNHARRTSNS